MPPARLRPWRRPPAITSPVSGCWRGPTARTATDRHVAARVQRRVQRGRPPDRDRRAVTATSRTQPGGTSQGPAGHGGVVGQRRAARARRGSGPPRSLDRAACGRSARRPRRSAAAGPALRPPRDTGHPGQGTHGTESFALRGAAVCAAPERTRADGMGRARDQPPPLALKIMQADGGGDDDRSPGCRRGRWLMRT